MSHRLSRIVLLVAALLAATDVGAELVTEATLVSGYQGNLFADSSSIGDAHATAGVQLAYYPSASAQITTGIVYHMYAENRDLSNLSAAASISLIPTVETSALRILLSGQASFRQFGDTYQLYDQVHATLSALASLRIISWAHVQTSLGVFTHSYTRSEFGSSRGWDLSTGLHLAVGGSNALALMFDYSWRLIDQPVIPDVGDFARRGRDPGGSEALVITGLSLRYSRPLGGRTGLSLSVGQRLLKTNPDYTIVGYTVDYLSPWADLWQGMNMSGSLKRYFPGQVTSELTAAYFSKSFVDVLQLDETATNESWCESRDDQLATVSLSLSRPWSLRESRQLVPTISIGYRTNGSSVSLFQYEELWASFAVSMTM